MKHKFLLTVLIAVSFSALATAIFVFVFLERESLRTVDQQLQTMASSIFAAGLSVEMMEDFDDVDDLLMEKLSEERVGRLIRIYNRGTHQLLYANEPARFLFMPEPSEEGFHTFDGGGGRLLRIFNISNESYLLQVALTLDPVMGRKAFLEKEFIGLSFFWVVVILGVTFLALKTLLQPLKDMALQVERMTQRLNFDSQWTHSAQEFQFEIDRWASTDNTDEIHELGRSLAVFASRLSQALDELKNQYAILAHELKTPLTIIRNNIAELEKATAPEQASRVQELKADVDRLSRLVSDFLQWGHLTSHKSVKVGVHANKLKEVVGEQIKQLSVIYPHRMQWNESLGAEQLRVLALPEHLQQATRNLIENACKYSNHLVEVEIQGHRLVIKDSGQGLPEEVQKHLGRPFNRGQAIKDTTVGSGLGLAWVKALCDTYGWVLKSKKWDHHHEVSIEFPSDNEENNE